MMQIKQLDFFCIYVKKGAITGNSLGYKETSCNTVNYQQEQQCWINHSDIHCKGFTIQLPHCHSQTLPAQGQVYH